MVLRLVGRLSPPLRDRRRRISDTGVGPWPWLHAEDGACLPGRPGQLPTQGSHRSGRAEWPPPARPVHAAHAPVHRVDDPCGRPRPARPQAPPARPPEAAVPATPAEPPPPHPRPERPPPVPRG